MPERWSPRACVYGGLVAAFLPRFTSFSNHRVLTRVSALSDRSSPLRCVSVSKIRPGRPVSVSEFPFSSSELPPTSETVATPAKTSGCREVSLLFERSRYRRGMPWKILGGRVSRSFPPRSKWEAFVRYSKSSLSSVAIFSAGGNVLSGLTLKVWSGLVTTRSVRFVIETSRVSVDAVHGVNAVTAAGVVVTPLRLTSSCRCLMISFATARLRVHRFTVSVPDLLRSSALVQSCPQSFSTGRFVSSPKYQASVRGALDPSAVQLPSRG